MSSMGDLAGLLGIQKTISAMGQGNKERREVAQKDRQLTQSDRTLDQNDVELKLREEAIRRGDPTLLELASQFKDAENKFPGSLGELFKIKNPTDPFTSTYRQAQFDNLIADNKRADEAAKRQQEVIDTNDLQDYHKSVDPTISSLLKIKDLEKELGVNDLGEVSDSYDVPGKSIPGIGRFYGLSDKSQAVKAIIADISKEDIHTFAGSAQTKQELENIKNAFEQGKFTNDKQILDGLRRYKALKLKGFQEAESIYRPEVIEKGRSRGGSSYQDFVSKGKVPTDEYPDTIVGSDGKTYHANKALKKIGPVME